MGKSLMVSSFPSGRMSVLTILTIAICPFIFIVAADQCGISTVGTDFMLGFTPPREHIARAGVYLHISTEATNTIAIANVTAPYLNYTRSLTVYNHTTLFLGGEFFDRENGSSFKGVEVHSDAEVSILAVVGPNDAQEGFLALPINALGTRYIAASYEPNVHYNSEFLVVGVEDNTQVDLTVMLNGQPGFNRTIILQRFETYQIISDKDPSGSLITSDRPVAVFSGSSFASVPHQRSQPQYIVEQMIPTKYFSKTFIISPIQPRAHFLVRIFADQDNTEVQCYNHSNHFVVDMNKGDMKELLFDTDPLVVEANKPISVVEYSYDTGDHYSGDPYMINVPGISQYVDSVQFSTQHWSSEQINTLAITINSSAVSGLFLNDQSMPCWNATNRTVAQPMNEFVTLFVNVSAYSYYRLHHVNGERFGVVIYGRYGPYAGYGYPLKMSFSDTDCDRLITETPYQTTLNPLSFPAGECVTLQSLTSGTTPAGDNDTWCFHCDGMSHLKYCDEVQRCPNANEVCYVQRYPMSLSVNLYRSGCMQQEKCASVKDVDGCTECCSGSYCNKKGCGDNSLGPRDQRGPLCFDCSHIGDDEECRTVQLCQPNQSCLITKHAWGANDFHYIMGCSDPNVCTNNSRHVPLCTHCCHGDLCNRSCMSNYTAPALIG